MDMDLQSDSKIFLIKLILSNITSLINNMIMDNAVNIHHRTYEENLLNFEKYIKENEKTLFTQYSDPELIHFNTNYDQIKPYINIVWTEMYNDPAIRNKINEQAHIQHISNIIKEIENNPKNTYINKVNLCTLITNKDNNAKTEVLNEIINQDAVVCLDIYLQMCGKKINFEQIKQAVRYKSNKIIKKLHEHEIDLKQENDYLLYLVTFHHNIELQHFLIDIGLEPENIKSKLKSAFQEEFQYLIKYKNEIKIINFSNKLDASLEKKEENNEQKQNKIKI